MYLQMSVLRRAHCYLIPSILAFIVQGSKKAKVLSLLQALHYRPKNFTVAEKIVLNDFLSC